MTKPIKLSVVKNEREIKRAREIRGMLHRRVGECAGDFGQDIAGYALVMWGRDGRSSSVVLSGAPIKSRMVPEFARDALNQHIAVDLAADEN